MNTNRALELLVKGCREDLKADTTKEAFTQVVIYYAEKLGARRGRPAAMEKPDAPTLP
jgi:hypothetical protein